MDVECDRVHLVILCRLHHEDEDGLSSLDRHRRQLGLLNADCRIGQIGQMLTYLFIRT